MTDQPADNQSTQTCVYHKLNDLAPHPAAALPFSAMNLRLFMLWSDQFLPGKYVLSRKYVLLKIQFFQRLKTFKCIFAPGKTSFRRVELNRAAPLALVMPDRGGEVHDIHKYTFQDSEIKGYCPGSKDCQCLAWLSGVGVHMTAVELHGHIAGHFSTFSTGPLRRTRTGKAQIRGCLAPLLLCQLIKHHGPDLGNIQLVHCNILLGRLSQEASTMRLDLLTGVITGVNETALNMALCKLLQDVKYLLGVTLVKSTPALAPELKQLVKNIEDSSNAPPEVLPEEEQSSDYDSDSAMTSSAAKPKF